MKLGNAAWGFRQTPLDKQLKITSAMGLALLEFNINNPAENSIALKATDDEIETVRRLYKKYNIELLCAASGNDFTRPKEDDNYTELRRCFDIVMLAEKLGIKKIRFFAGFSALKEVKGKRFSCMIKCLNDLCGFAADHNVSISLETHGGVDTVPGGVRHFPTVSTDQAGIKSMLAKMDSRIMFNYDPSNLLAAGSDPLEIWDIIKDRVDYMHLKDFIPVA
ncbi:MAG TPA: hypothetical protein DC049_10185, partial [Spirochaetia bacterium]|nr:hypothetical protein [Spirochaetia bacterium]